MPALSFDEARQCILREVHAAPGKPAVETVALLDSAGRVLAENIAADRDYPPVARSVRDGFAFRSGDTAATLRVIGEVRAGESFAGAVEPGEAVEIMTGAPVPRGADAVIMIEHASPKDGAITLDRAYTSGDAINPQGSEARKGDVVLQRGCVLNFASIALLATVGRTAVDVYRRPSVAILATGDEIVEVGDTPLEYQVRNSNACSLAVQVRRAGGIPDILPVARDKYDSTRELVERGLEFDLLLLSGGVSAGKYDIVERVLADCGAGFYFDRVRIQPGQPLVFGRARSTFFFGLPGNPLSTMVTFETLARAALELLCGQHEPLLPIAHARLSQPFRQRPGLTRFLPAILNGDGSVTPVRWAGSSDVASMARANALLVTEETREFWDEGEWIGILMK